MGSRIQVCYIENWQNLSILEGYKWKNQKTTFYNMKRSKITSLRDRCKINSTHFLSSEDSFNSPIPPTHRNVFITGKMSTIFSGKKRKKKTNIFYCFRNLFTYKKKCSYLRPWRQFEKKKQRFFFFADPSPLVLWRQMSTFCLVNDP